jgi:hypothetical protein
MTRQVFFLTVRNTIPWDLLLLKHLGKEIRKENELNTHEVLGSNNIEA